MAEPKPKISIVGIILVALGLALLLDRLDVVDIGFGRIVWIFAGVLGAWLVFRGFLYNERGKAYWGTVLFLFSIYFLLRNFGLVEFHGRTFLPAALLVLGFAFLMLFVQNPRAWQVLIPAVILGGLGAVFILADLGYLYGWDVAHAIRTYWPVVLILIGISMVLKRRDGQWRRPSSGVEGGPATSDSV